eukprot:s7605_g1.t1
MSSCQDAFQQGMGLADQLLAAAGSMQFVPYTVPGMPVLKQLTLEESQIARLRGRTLVGRSRRKLAPSLDVASSMQAAAPKIGRTPVKARPPLPVAPSGPVPLAPAASKAAPVAPGGAGVTPLKRRLPLAKAAEVDDSEEGRRNWATYLKKLEIYCLPLSIAGIKPVEPPPTEPETINSESTKYVIVPLAALMRYKARAEELAGRVGESQRLQLVSQLDGQERAEWSAR